VKNLERVKRFYTDAIGLDVLPVNRFISRRLRCTTSRSRSTRATSTPSWLACRASGSTWRRLNTAGVVGGPSTSATRRATYWSSCAMTRRSS